MKSKPVAAAPHRLAVALVLSAGLGPLEIAVSEPEPLLPRPPGIHQETFPAPRFGTLRYTVEVPARRPGSPRPPLVLALHYGFDPQAFPPYYGRGLLEGLVGPALAGLGAVIIAPDSHARPWTDPDLSEAVLALLEAAAHAYQVDPTRKVVTGYSLGGIGSWHLAVRAPQAFSAAIVVSARADPSLLEQFPTLPLYVIHSARDEVFPAAEVTAAVDALRAAGHEVEYRLLDGPTHYQVGAFTGALRSAGNWLQDRWMARP